MIKSIEMARFRGVETGRIDGLTGVSVLVGPNGCGKSTVLDALLITADSATGPALLRANRRRSNTPNPTRWLARGGRIGASSAALRATDDSEITREVILEFTTEEHGTEIAVTLNIKSGEAALTKMTFQFGVPWAGAGALTRGSAGANIPLIDARTAGEPLHRLLSQAANQGGRDFATGIVTQLLPWVDHLEILTEMDQPVLNLIRKSDKGNVPVGVAGDGVEILVRTALELVRIPSGLALMEEPEIHLYPAALRQTARVIAETARRGVQIVISTHSLELIDAIVEALGKDAANLLSVHRLRLDSGKLIDGVVNGKDVAFERETIEADLR